MNKMKKGIIPAGILAAIAGILAAIAILVPKIQVAPQSQTFGSVTGGNEYFSTTTAELAVGSQTLIRSGQTTLGSIVVASSSISSVFPFKIWNATTSVATQSKVPTTTIASLATNASNGTYTFDVMLDRGLVVEVPAGFVGSFIITYR